MDTAPSSCELRVFVDAEETCAALADSLVVALDQRLSSASHFNLALCGGETPRRLFRLLASEYRERLPWERLRLFWGDDRFVAHDDPSSNYRTAREAMLDHVPIPAANIHAMPTFFHDPAEAAAEYEAMLKEHFRGPWPRFDLMLQGMGPDGHTASLFPRSPALREASRWVVAVEADAEPRRRLTLTLPVLNHAARVWFLVTGESKRGPLEQVFAEEADPWEIPAAGVVPEDGELIWWVDAAAAVPMCGAGHDEGL